MTIKGDPTNWDEFVLARFVYNYKSHSVHWKSIYSEDGCGALISSGNNGNGYLRTKVCGKKIYVHHIVWILVTGEKPAEGMQIDHIDGNKQNNACHNLRMVDPSTNMHNTKRKGYYWNTKNKKWRAYITINKQRIFLGYFNTEEEARAAYVTAKKLNGFIHR